MPRYALGCRVCKVAKNTRTTGVISCRLYSYPWIIRHAIVRNAELIVYKGIPVYRKTMNNLVFLSIKGKTKQAVLAKHIVCRERYHDL